MTEPGEVNFGEELRRQRLVREVSLESIAAATKISVRYLEALEKGDSSRLPAPVFTRGFIRAYASHLGLDPEEMVNAYLAETGAVPLRSVAEPRRRQEATRRPSAAAIAVGVLVTALLILMFAGIWRFTRRRPTAARTPSPAAAVAPPPNIREVIPAPVASTESQSPAAPGIALSLNFHADCWLELFADERLIYSGILRGGEIRHFEAQKGFRMTLGNAAAASVSVNGRPLPPLGRDGEVLRDYRIDASSLQAPAVPGT